MTNMSEQKPFLKIFQGERDTQAPWWMMRQAGRYLPEYQQVRAQAGGFLDLVYNPDLACEVSMQPIRRYEMDAAIVFSDILVIPQALGQELWFEIGEGPKLTSLKNPSDIRRLNFSRFHETLSPIYQTVSNIRHSLVSEGFDQTALIGFAGAPWTVACYMIEGGGSKDFVTTKKWAYQNPESFSELIDLLIDSTTEYLLGQISAGAEAVQIFDSWAGTLDEDGFKRWVIQPTKKIIENLKGQYPEVPVIGFPRQGGSLYHPFVQQTGVDAVSLDPSVATSWAKRVLQPICVVQGNLDPVRLLVGGDSLMMAVEKICVELKEGPFIFNLGHGVIKDTPPEHVALLKEFLSL